MAAMLNNPLTTTASSADDGEQSTQTSAVAVNPKALDSSLFSATVNLQLDSHTGELSSPPLVNSEDEQSIPREVISSALSTSSLQAELMRPLIAGTYNTLPAYLLKLQFNFQTGNSGWSRRIRSANISVVFEDARNDTAVVDGAIKGWARPGKPAEHPVIGQTFPVGEGWKGPISTATLEQSAEVGVGAGWAGMSASVGVNHGISRERPGTARITTLRTGGSARNTLSVTLTENPVSRTGIPYFVQLPVIIIHHSRRFKMRVMVRATFGFWRGKLASSIPVLGRLDEPLFFDPGVLSDKMEREERGVDGTRVVEWLGDLQGINLQEHSSLRETVA